MSRMNSADTARLHNHTHKQDTVFEITTPLTIKKTDPHAFTLENQPLF